jgi:glycosyltransferase involved in cell wall biosynthesis
LNLLNVSVIIPTCDRPHELERALASVKVSVECILVVDDCSSASVLEEVTHGCERDSRVQLLKNSVRRGASYCRNLGAEKAQTKWLLFLDDDDQICDGYLDSMVPLLEEYPEVLAWIPNVQGGRSRVRSLVPLSDAQTRNRVSGCSGFMIRKVQFDAVGGFDVEFTSMQDWELWLRLIGQDTLHYSGVVGVVYDSSSNKKITHNLRSKYQGLRRLYFKYANLWTCSARRDHLLRLWVLRRLLSGRRGLLGNWIASSFKLQALYYTYRWRGFVSSQTCSTKRNV